MKETQYDTAIGELKESIKEQGRKLSELLQKRAEGTCEFQVGDTVVNKGGQSGEVVNIKASFGEGMAVVRLHKKDGSLGLRTTNTYSWEDWKLQ